MLTPSDIRNLYPIMNTEDVLGGLYNADDGSLDPAGYCEGLTRAAKLRGAQVISKFYYQDDVGQLLQLCSTLMIASDMFKSFYHYRYSFHFFRSSPAQQ